MSNNRKYTERSLPYGAKAICVECKPKLKATVKFKAYKFMDGYFDFLEINALTVLGYYLVTRNNMEDVLYVAYKPEDCDVNRLISETGRYFKNVFRKDVVTIDKNGSSKLGYCSSFRIFTNYVLAGFKIPIAHYAEEFETYLIDELHLSEDIAIGHADKLELISNMTWRSTKPANNTYRKNPTDIDKYVSSLYLYDKNEKELEKTLKTTLTLFLRYMQYRHEKYLKRLSSYQSVLVTPQVEIKESEDKPIVEEEPITKEEPIAKEESITKPEPKLDKTIRIDINMDDIDEFLDYLEKREPNRQQRQRYKKQLEELYQNGWNQYKHNTFIDDKKYRVNAKDIEVFVNGMKSRDFNVTVKEYEDTIELYLSYRWTKKYHKDKRTDKEEAIPPKYKTRAKKEEPKKDIDTEGKKIFATINHYDSWKSNEEDSQPPKTEATTQYIGEATGQRKSASMKNAVITEDENTVNIKMELSGKSLIPSGEENAKPEDSDEKPNSKEEENEPVEQEKTEGSVKNENDEPQASPTEEENTEKPSEVADTKEEENKLDEQDKEGSSEKDENDEPQETPTEEVNTDEPSKVENTEEEKDDKKTLQSVRKRNRKMGWVKRIIEWIKSWFS